jgi:predicted GNAT family N-acyltransferase
MELVELGPLSARDWEVLLDGEEDPFPPFGPDLEWLEKDRHVGLRGDDGRLIAVGGASVVELAVEGAGSFEVVGVGNVVVTHSRRGEGLMPRVFDALLEMAAGMGPDRAMLFCRPGLESLYAKWGFQSIDAPVWADQPDGRVELPQTAMWRPLRDGAGNWPPGRVDVRGLPF